MGRKQTQRELDLDTGIQRLDGKIYFRVTHTEISR